MSTDSKPQQYEQFFCYTSGRWLWDEEEELRKRCRKFNVEELKRIAAESISAKSRVSMTKLGEGGYSKVFKLVTASEVATMDFARTILNIPVPRIYAWSPWKSAHDYLKALAHNQIKWLSQQAVREPPTNISPGSEAQDSPEAHIALYEKFLSISPHIFPNDERLTRSTLWHWDLHAPNPFVKDDRITRVIDWQSTWAGPLLLQYRSPKLVNYAGDVILQLPDNCKEMGKSEKGSGG